MPQERTGVVHPGRNDGTEIKAESGGEMEQLLAIASHYCQRNCRVPEDEVASVSPVMQALRRACDGCLQASQEARRSFQSYSDNRLRQRELLTELLSLLELTIKDGVLGETTGARQPRAETARSGSLACKDAVQAVLEVLHESADEAIAFDEILPVTSTTPSAVGWTLCGSGAAAGQAGPDRTAPTREEIASPSLSVYLLSNFQVLLDGEPVNGWPNCRGKSVFKYLVTHRMRPIPKEVLMNTFWPDADPDAARNNLNVAVYGLRKILAGVNASFSYVLFQGDHYLLNPALHVWVDSEAFAAHVARAKAAERAGSVADAISEYCAAEKVYQSDLLVEDRYEEWLVDLRRQFQDMYLHALERLSQYWFDNADFESCISACTKILRVDPCFEGAHRRMMRCYSRLGQPHISVRQYRYCVEALGKELNLAPSAETISLYRALRSGVSI